MKDKLLSLLAQEKTYVSGSRLGELLGVSRSAVWKMVEQLRQGGHVIDAVSRRGYLLVAEADILGRAAAARAFRTAGVPDWPGQVYYASSTDSTNLMARRAAEEGAPSKSIFFTEDQQKGRGRLGRDWQGQPGLSLAFSLLLRPAVAVDKLAPITLFAGLMAARALQGLLEDQLPAKSAKPAVAIKWPNDLVARESGRKLGGILTETMLEENRVFALIIGIGLNLGQAGFPASLPWATSVLKEWSVSLRRLDVLAAIIKNFAQAEKIMFEPAAWLPAYRSNCLTLGRQVLLHGSAGQAEKALALDLDEAGQLLVLDQAGQKKTVRAGQVSVRGLEGYI